MTKEISLNHRELNRFNQNAAEIVTQTIQSDWDNRITLDTIAGNIYYDANVPYFSVTDAASRERSYKTTFELAEMFGNTDLITSMNSLGIERTEPRMKKQQSFAPAP